MRRATGIAMAMAALAAASVAQARSPSISLKAPQSVAGDSTYSITVSGYFNNTKRKAASAGANVAYVAETKHTLTCSRSAIQNKSLGWRVIAGGPEDKKMRAKTTTTPGHFSATEMVKSPGTGGNYTLCAYLVNYPYTGVLKPTATAHVTVQPPVPYTLTVSIAGSDGQVSSVDLTNANAPDILCDPARGYNTCSASYAHGDDIVLEADSPNVFIGWSGACSGSDPTQCEITMNGNKTVTATFGGPVSP